MECPPSLTGSQQFNLFLIRSTLSAIVVSTALLPSLFQPGLDQIWAGLKTSWLYRLSFWETILTVASYAAIEAFYTSLVIDPRQPHGRIDRRSGRSHLYRNGTVLVRPYGRRAWELVQYAAPLLLLDGLMVKKFVGVSREDIILSGGYQLPKVANGIVDAIRDGVTQLDIRESWKVPTLHHFTWSSPLQLLRALPETAPTSREVTLGIIGALLIYDGVFCLIHILFHKVPSLWRIHLPHHQHAEIHPQVTNHLSITERLTLLAAANLALHLVSAHPLTRTLFVPLFLYLLIENHAGLDLPYGYHRILPEGWVAGPLDHAEHHRHGKANFQPYLTWADRLLRTYSTGFPNPVLTSEDLYGGDPAIAVDRGRPPGYAPDRRGRLLL